MKSPDPKTYVIWVFILALAVAFATPLVDPSEARFALIARISTAQGSILNPLFYDNNNNLVHYYSKPPLFIWLVMFFQNIFPLELAQRLPSILAGAVYVFTCRSVLTSSSNQSSQKFFETISSYPAFFVFLVIGIIDPVFSLFLFLSVASWVLWRNCWLAGLFCGLSVLSKGPVGLALLLPSLLAWSALSIEKKDYKQLATQLVQFLLTTALSAGWWFAYTGIIDPNFFKYYLFEENIGRFLGASEIKYGTLHREPLGLALLAAGLFLLPKPLDYLNSLKLALLSSFETAAQKLAKGLATLAVWTTGVFSLSQTFLVSYLMPLSLCIPFVGSLIGAPKAGPNRFRILNLVAPLSIIFYSAVCLYYVIVFDLPKFLIPFLVGIIGGLKFSKRLWLAYLTFAAFMIVAPLRSNFDLKDFQRTDLCPKVFHFHPRHHTAQLYFSGNLERTQRREFTDGECVLVEEDDIYDNSLEIIFKGRLLSVAKVSGIYMVK